MKRLFPLSIWFCLITSLSFSQDNTVPLWSGKIPNQRDTNEKEIYNQKNILRIENVQEPTLEIYLPSKQSATGKAMVICPGGGYGMLAYDWEGTDIAKWLNSKGIAAFVLKYRLPGSKSIILKNKAPLQDAQRAMKLVRYNSKKWNVSPDQIGVMGFSAGGHLASTLGTHYDMDDNSIEPSHLDSISARPDFMILIYPVITMKSSYTHQGSRNNLLGKNPDQKLVDFYSNELHVTKTTPPTFIVHSTNDKVVPVMNSILLYQALTENEIYTAMHIYPEGGHGFSLAVGRGYLQGWTDRLSEWLEGLK